MHVFRFWSWADMGVKIHSLDAANHVVELERDTRYGLMEGRQFVIRFRNLLK